MFSVIIPSFNRRHTLGRAIESVFAQSGGHEIELIVVDDGSSDGTDQWLRHKYPQIRYLGQQNRGVSAARNTGLRLAKGSWVVGTCAARARGTRP